MSQSTLNGLTGFYSADSLIFGLIVAFVINREWEKWTKLSESARDEVDAVRELWKWSTLSDKTLCDQAHAHLEKYLRLIVSEWKQGQERVRSRRVDAELDSLRTLLAPMSPSMHGTEFQLQAAFTTLVQARNKRLNYGNEKMPGILKRIVIMADAMFILLSLFIAVNNLFLDYVFTAAIGLLAFALITVVDDLDNPFRPGVWQLTTEGYENLLKELLEK
jgi:hypothetical protein